MSSERRIINTAFRLKSSSIWIRLKRFNLHFLQIKMISREMNSGKKSELIDARNTEKKSNAHSERRVFTLPQSINIFYI